MRHTLLDKGLECIWHDGNAAYYKALVMLDDLSDVQRLMRNKETSVAAFNKLLQDRGMADSSSSNRPLALEDLDGGTAEFVADTDALLPVQIEAHSAMQASLQPMELPPLGAAAHGQVVVHFDNCSHASGVLRGYVKCPWGHEACFQV